MNRPSEDAASRSKDDEKGESEKRRYRVHAVHALAGVVTNGQAEMGAATYLGELRGALRPRDAIEEMLIDQIAVTHARVMRLSSQSVIQQNETWYRTISETCDRAASTFRRLVVTFRDYREPRRTTVMAIQQANLANQQIVQQITGMESSDVSKALPAVGEGAEIASGECQAQPAVAKFDRSKDARGKESVENERAEARSTVSGRSKRRTHGR